MNKHTEMKNSNQTTPADKAALRPWFAKPWVVVSIIVLVVGTVFGMLMGAVWYSGQPRPGMLVITSAGCQVLAHHGMKTEPLDQGLCALHARFKDVRGSKPPRMLVRSDDGVQVEFLASEVVSRGSKVD